MKLYNKNPYAGVDRNVKLNPTPFSIILPKRFLLQYGTFLCYLLASYKSKPNGTE